MKGRDVLLRGRGAEVGVRAPAWLVRCCGAMLGIAFVALADLLGVWGILGIPMWVVHLVAMAGGALVAPTRAGVMLWWLNGGVGALLILVMHTPLVRPLVPAFVRADAPGANVDAVVVLSGGLTDDGLIGGQALDRLLSAMSLVRDRAIAELAVSIVVVEDSPGRASSEADQRALVALAAPQVSVRFVRDVHSTRDEALAFSALARTHGWRRVAVVTSPMHTARACGAIAKAGLVVECRPAAPRDYSLRNLDSGGSRRLAFIDVLYETTATVLYRVRGWM
jgi:uncharacterized SAM-binding protein YcdF (DUF218 family)